MVSTINGHPAFTHFTSYFLLPDFTTLNSRFNEIAHRLTASFTASMFGYVAPCTTSSLCTPTPDFVHLLRHDCQNHAPSTLLAMSTARNQMSPHILPSLLRFGLLPPSRSQCYVSSLSLISKILWSHVLVLYLF